MQQTNYEIRVGLFSLFALILLVWGWAWLKSFSLFHPPQRFIARFDDVAGLSNNATVNVQGVRVGTVEALRFTPEKKIDLHVKVTQEGLSIPKGSDFSIQTLGLVGAKYLEITLPRTPDGKLINNPPLTENDVVYPVGEAPNDQLAANGVVHNPVRTELMLNNVATRINDIVQNIDTEAASKALNNLSSASQKLNNNMDRLRDAAESVKTASNSIANTSARFGTTADNASAASARANTFFKDGDVAVRKVSDLATEFTGTSHHINHLLDNPNFSSDLKETIAQARQTAETVRAAIGDVNTTLKDKDLREQVLGSLTRLQQATENIRASMQTVDKLSGDQGLRSDLKDIVHNARETMSEANALLSEPTFKADIRSTLAKVKGAACNVEAASKQVQQILGKRAPLLHMLFGRPGKQNPQDVCPPDNCPVPVKTTQPTAVPVAPTPGRP